MPESIGEILSQLTDLICSITLPHPVRVAIDGVDAAGKTYLADALVPWVAARGRPVVRASIDGFHNPRKLRYRQGVCSPEGYYQDSFNYQVLIDDLLMPLGLGGDRRYRSSGFNLKDDEPLREYWHEAPVDSVLLFDGVFLLRPALLGYWEYSIFVDVDFEVSLHRAVARDFRPKLGSRALETLREKYYRRYVPGQRLYFAEAKPKEQASIILKNNDYHNPMLIIK